MSEGETGGKVKGEKGKGLAVGDKITSHGAQDRERITPLYLQVQHHWTGAGG
jgi:hypothetical protein